MMVQMTKRARRPNALKLLAEARILAAKNGPYFRSGLMAMIPVERVGLGTCAMDRYGRIYYDQTFLADRELKHRAFVVMHEFVHWHQRHADRQFAVCRNDPEKLSVWRLVVDGVTNEIVRTMFGGWVPEEGVTMAKLNLPPNLSVEQAFAIKWKEYCDEKQRRREKQKRQQEEAERQRQQEQEQGGGQEGDEKPQDGSDESADGAETADGQDQGSTHEQTDENGGDDHGRDEDCSGVPEGTDSEDEADDGTGDHSDSQNPSEENQEIGDEPQNEHGQGQGQEEGQGEDQAGSDQGDGPQGDGADQAGADVDPDSGGDGAGGGDPTSAEGTGTDGDEAEEGGDIFGGFDPKDGGSASDGQPRPWELGPPSENDPGLTESDQDIIEARIAHDIEDAVSRGTMPSSNPLAKQAKDLLHKPVDPCREIAAMARYAVEVTSGFGDYSYHRMSNRQIPGGCILPSCVKPIPRITLIGDGSGSMNAEDTALIYEVLGSVLKNLPDPSGLRVLVGGVQVTAAARVFRKDQIQILDSGGTDMGELIRQADKERPAPKVIVVVTDCETPWCEESEVQAKVLVCATRKSRWHCPPPAWMKTVYLKPED